MIDVAKKKKYCKLLAMMDTLGVSCKWVRRAALLLGSLPLVPCLGHVTHFNQTKLLRNTILQKKTGDIVVLLARAGFPREHLPKACSEYFKLLRLCLIYVS